MSDWRTALMKTQILDIVSVTWYQEVIKVILMGLLIIIQNDPATLQECDNFKN